MSINHKYNWIVFISLTLELWICHVYCYRLTLLVHWNLTTIITVAIKYDKFIILIAVLTITKSESPINFRWSSTLNYLIIYLYLIKEFKADSLIYYNANVIKWDTLIRVNVA